MANERTKRNAVNICILLKKCTYFRLYFVQRGTIINNPELKANSNKINCDILTHLNNTEQLKGTNYSYTQRPG